MESTIPTFGPREIIGLIVTLAAVVAFLVSGMKLTFAKNRDKVDAAYNPGGGGFHLSTRNLSIVTLCVSAILLAVMGTAVFAQTKEKWVYLGVGYGDYKWSFLTLDKKKTFSANDIVEAQKDVNIREDHFSNFTETWLSFLSPPEPEITGTVKKGECVRVLGFKSVGLNKVWMNILPVECP